jgi:HEAT repeat protein
MTIFQSSIFNSANSAKDIGSPTIPILVFAKPRLFTPFALSLPPCNRPLHQPKCNMRARLKIGLALVAVALVAGGASLLLGRHEAGPIVEGKPLSAWLRNYQRADPQTRARIDQILRATGTNMIPTLLRMLRERDSAPKLKLVQLIQTQHLIRFRPNFAADRNQEASYAFAILGPAGRDAVPALVQIYNDNVSSISRFWTAISLANIGPAASNAVPVLIAGVTNSIMDVRLGSITALDNIHSQPQLTVPALATALHDQQATVRYYAVLAVARFGPQATSAIPALEGLVKDPDRSVRQGAIDALARIGPQARTNSTP